MATEELTLVVNDVQLTMALAKIGMIRESQKRTTSGARGLSSLISKTRKEAKEAGINLDDLPTLNRDMRLILGMVPGFRQASRLFFQTRRAVRAAQLGREAEALRAAGLAPELAKGLGTAALIGQVALIVFSLKLLMDTAKRIDRIQKQMIRDLGDYEIMAREGLDLTHEEYEELDKSVVGYATAWEEFKAKWDAKEYWDAISDYVISRIGVQRPPTFLGRLPYDTTTVPEEIRENWLYQIDKWIMDRLRGNREELDHLKEPPGWGEEWEEMKRHFGWPTLEEFAGWREEWEEMKRYFGSLIPGLGGAREDTDHRYDWNLGDGPLE